MFCLLAEAVPVVTAGAVEVEQVDTYTLRTPIFLLVR